MREDSCQSCAHSLNRAGNNCDVIHRACAAHDANRRELAEESLCYRCVSHSHRDGLVPEAGVQAVPVPVSLWAQSDLGQSCLKSNVALSYMARNLLCNVNTHFLYSTNHICIGRILQALPPSTHMNELKHR